MRPRASERRRVRAVGGAFCPTPSLDPLSDSSGGRGLSSAATSSFLPSTGALAQLDSRTDKLENPSVPQRSFSFMRAVVLAILVLCLPLLPGVGNARADVGQRFSRI